MPRNRRRRRRLQVVTADSDRLSIGMDDLVPDEFDGTDRYLDVIQRNLARNVSRIDLTAVSLASETQVAGELASVVRWKPIQEVLRDSAGLTDSRVRALLAD